jgi:hypothetical protein
MEPEETLAYLQEHVTGPYPIQSTPYNPISLRPMLILHPIYDYVFRVVSSFQASQSKFCTHFLSPPIHPPISSFLISSS